MITEPKKLRHERPNMHGELQLWECEEGGYTLYVTEYFGEDDYEELDPEYFDTREEADHAFSSYSNQWSGKPNYHAQAAYDEAHGTINGEDARIVEYRELVGEY